MVRSFFNIPCASWRAALLAGILAPVTSAAGGEVPHSHSGSERVTLWGASECELNAGMFASFKVVEGSNRPAINYEFQTLRLGWMLEDVGRSGFWRGNGEFLVGVFGGAVQHGPGSGLVGGEFVLRYNFGERDSRLRPFAQVGAGGLYNDIHKDRGQVLVGMGFEFMLHGGVGAHIMLEDNWALNLEVDYRHISNAGLASRNGGLNSLGGTIGFSYFFR